MERLGEGRWDLPGGVAPLANKGNVRIKIVEAPRSTRRQSVLETPQKASKELPPEDARFLAEQNHRAKVETRLPEGRSGKPGEKEVEKRPPVQEGEGWAKYVPRTEEWRDRAARGEGGSGMQPLPDDVKVGDAVDLNTTEFRYVGYFVHLRRALEMAWVYPAAAQRHGLTGAGQCLFRINEDGAVDGLKILGSTGHGILDMAFVDAVRRADFPPLPKSWGQKSLTIDARFSYGRM